MRKLSHTQLNMLRGIRDHGNPLFFVRGQSQHGGANGTRASLQRHGLVDAQVGLTDAGRAALAADDARCRHCGEERGEHTAVGMRCPIGCKHRVLGYTQFSSKHTYEPRKP